MNAGSYNNPDTTAGLEHTTLAALFADRESAHEAISRLHDDGFHDTWLGLIRSDDTSSSGSLSGGSYADDATTAGGASGARVEAENWFMRVFGEGDESLLDALVRHGVSEADAREAGISGSFPAHSAVLTVHGGNDPEAAADIITANGGRLITRGFGATGSYAGSATAGAFGSTATTGGFGSTATSGTYASTEPAGFADVEGGAAGTGLGMASTSSTAKPYDVGAETGVTNTLPASATPGRLDEQSTRNLRPLDETTRLQLREERLRIDKERLSRGEATISKEVVTEKHEIDVPLVHEELFIERRPASATTTATSTGPIGESETVRVALTEEVLNVTKAQVVTEEVVIGKREVTETGHVSETTRREELIVDGVDADTTTSNAGLSGASRSGVTSNPRI